MDDDYYSKWVREAYGPDPHPGYTALWAIIWLTGFIAGSIALIRWWAIHACDYGC